MLGEVLEHISNPGLVLDSIKKAVHPDGIIIITVPNAFSFSRIKQTYKQIPDEKWTHDQHVAWYSKATIKALVERHGYKVISINFVTCKKSKNITTRIKNILRFRRFMKESNSESVLLVAKLASQP
jgi:hypothetical protein